MRNLISPQAGEASLEVSVLSGTRLRAPLVFSKNVVKLFIFCEVHDSTVSKSESLSRNQTRVWSFGPFHLFEKSLKALRVGVRWALTPSFARKAV